MDNEDSEQVQLHEDQPMKCQLCSMSLHKLSPDQRQAHYDKHFNEEAHASSSSPGKLLSEVDRNKTSVLPPPSKQNVFWFPAQSSEPPSNFTPGLIPTLKRALLKTHAKGLTTRATLCHEGATHVATEHWDRGWGCGYRNFLMVCTALIGQSFQPLYFPLLDDPIPPGVRNLQYWIEDAWANGLDREGAEQLKHKLVGTRKWIGTAELYVAFVSRGIPARLVDFPGSDRGPEAVTEWVIKYFTPPVQDKRPTDAFSALKGASPVLCSDRMPLVLQHAGHSRTVIGFEVNKKGGTNLLIFDPSIRPSQQLRRAALANHTFPVSPSKTKSRSPSILHRVLHPHESKTEAKNRKRRVSSALLDADERQVKRVRRGLQGSRGDNEDDTIVLDKSGDDSMQQDEETLDPIKVVNFFRVNQNKLGKNDRYQILYFPLDPPFEVDERWSHRVVTSERVV